MKATLKHKVFIVGCARSGTTWVRSILSQHENVVGGRPESHLFPVLYGPLTAGVPRRRAEVLRAFDDRVEMRAYGGPHRWVDRSTLEHLLAQAEAKGYVGEAMRCRDAHVDPNANLIRSLLGGPVGHIREVVERDAHVSAVPQYLDDPGLRPATQDPLGVEEKPLLAHLVDAPAGLREANVTACLNP